MKPTTKKWNNNFYLRETNKQEHFNHHYYMSYNLKQKKNTKAENIYLFEYSNVNAFFSFLFEIRSQCAT